MNTIVNKISIDLMKPTEPLIIHAVQGERNSRIVELTLLEDGRPWTLPEGALLTVRYGRSTLSGGYYDTLPDGTTACTYDGNIITVILAPQMMSEAGAVLTQIEILHQEQLLTTFSFRLMVEINPAVGIVQPETYVNWLQWMQKELETYTNKIIEEGDFTGPAGPQGAPAALLSTVVVYQAGDSGSIIPSGSWSSTVPVVPQGKYLWTRITNTFNSGDPVVYYSVSRMGLDGSGSIVTVAGISPDEDGNIPLTAKNIGALPSTGGKLTGTLNMNGQKITGLNEPSESTEAATKGYVDKIDWFSNGTSIPANSDLNTYTTNGKYYQTGSVATLVNCPTMYNFVLFVFVRTTKNVKTQLIIDFYGNMYIRGNNATSWKDWVKYTVQTDIDAAIEQLRGEMDNAVRKTAVRNLLDNSDFTDLVAQAGILGTHGTSVYFADRWKIGGVAPSYNEESRKITFSSSGTSMLRQKVAGNISGKTVTLAVKASDVSGIVYISESGAQSGHADVKVENGITIHTFAAADNMDVLVWSGEGACLTIDWLALYEGEYTADSLPAYRPKGYGAELLECQRYYQIHTANNMAARDMRPIMRLSSPTITAVETGGYSYSADL